MTYLCKDIADHLSASVSIRDAVGDRIYPDIAPQPVRAGQAVELYPLIIISDLTNTPEYSLAGESGTHSSMIQVDVWTDGTGGKHRSNEIGELVRNRLSGYRGRFGTGCYGTARMIRNNSVAAPPVDGSDTHRRRVSMDFEITHSASAPTFT